MTARLDTCFILPAGPGDATALARVHVQAWRETYTGLLPIDTLHEMHAAVHTRRFTSQLMRATPGEVILLAEGADGIIGYCAGSALSGAAEAEVFTLYLLARAQGLGLGRRLLSACAKALMATGAKSLRLWVLEGNTRAAAFYLHLGGQRGETRPVQGWGGGHSETVYRWAKIGLLA